MTTTSIPPQILQSFNSKLLSSPAPKFREDSESLKNVYNYIKTKLMKRSKASIERHTKCCELETEFLELYERIKKKEEEHQATKNHHSQRPFYMLPSFSEKSDEIFRRLKYKR